MRFITMRAGDIEAIKERSKMLYDKLEGPKVAEESIVGVDDAGVARIVISAERVAELYMVLDHEWQTPAMRWAMIEQAHKEMLGRLKVKGYRVGYSFFADGVPNGYIRRLIPLGWTRMIDRCVRYVVG